MNSPISADEAYDILAAGAAPENWHVAGELDYSQQSERPLPPAFPRGLHVDVLKLSGREIAALPAGLCAYEVDLSETPIRTIPADWQIASRLVLTRCEHLESLPDGLTVGSLNLRGCTSLVALPERLDVWFLDMSGCWAFERWPRSAQIRSGQLQLRACTAVRELPAYLGRLSALNAQDCPNLASLPPNLVVTGWLDLGRSGLTTEAALPGGVASAQLRWAGVNIDRRIAFHPETITVNEVLSERNSERRRVLLDRYGYGRLLQDARADVLDRDFDPGGERQLMRIKLENDEDLVALSCLCPSTGRQYIIRVPPQTMTCHAAAAWIAGFDDPHDYQPLVET